MMNKKLVILTLSALVLLSGCTDKVVKEAQRTTNFVGEDRGDSKPIINYEKRNDNVEDVVQENPLEEKELLPKKNLTSTDSFSDETEFAQFISSILFKFRSSEITPEEFYLFLTDYSIQEQKERLLKSEDNKNIYSNIQSLYEKSNVKPQSYVISSVSLSTNKKEGYFYRKTITNKGEEYSITTIVKENNTWKFSEDSPSPPFDLKEEE